MTVPHSGIPDRPELHRPGWTVSCSLARTSSGTTTPRPGCGRLGPEPAPRRHWLCAFFFVASYTLSFLSVFTLRVKEPDTPRPYRVPGFPFTTGLVLVASVAFLVGSVVTDWSNSWKSLLLLALGYPVYRLILAARGRAGAR
jgi:hypothetical protein